MNTDGAVPITFDNTSTAVILSDPAALRVTKKACLGIMLVMKRLCIMLTVQLPSLV